MVDRLFPVGVAMHFKDDVRTCLQELRATLQPGHRSVSGLIPQQKLPACEYRFTGPLLAALGDRGNKDLPTGKTGKIAGPWFAHEGVHMVNQCALVDAELGGAD